MGCCVKAVDTVKHWEERREEGGGELAVLPVSVRGAACFTKSTATLHCTDVRADFTKL